MDIQNIILKGLFINTIIYTIFVIYTVFIGYITYSFLNFIFGKPTEVYIKGSEQNNIEIKKDKELSKKMNFYSIIISLFLTIVISEIYFLSSK